VLGYNYQTGGGKIMGQEELFTPDQLSVIATMAKKVAEEKREAGDVSWHFYSDVANTATRELGRMGWLR
jgi:hypothetical protein